MSDNSKLTAKQQKFVSSYVKNGNATKAAKEAYPDATYAAQRVIASENLTKPNVQQKIQDILSQEGLTPQLIISELKQLIVDSDDKGEKNKAIRTAAEIMGLIGASKGSIFTNVNIDAPFNSPYFSEMIDFLRKENKLV